MNTHDALRIFLGAIIGLTVAFGMWVGYGQYEYSGVVGNIPLQHNFQPTVGYRPNLAVGRVGGGVVRRNFSEVHLVVAHFKEDLTWLRDKWGAAYTHTVYEMARGEQTPDFSESFAQPIDDSRYYLTNFGDESSGYLRFIIDHYDALPDVTVFLHGKPEGHNPQISTWIRCLRKTTWFTFLTRGYVEDRCILDMKNDSLIPNTDGGAFIDFWKQFPWAGLGLGSLPRCLSLYCCAEFAVSRDAIRSKPLTFYKELWSLTLNFVLDQNTARKYRGWSLRQIGGIYEHAWHVMFGEPMMMQSYTYCDYFNPKCGPCTSDSAPPLGSLPPNHPTRRSQRGILIMDAFIGSNCRGLPAPQEISAIVGLAKVACVGKMSCSYTVEFPKNVKIGRTPNTLDPLCRKDYDVSWLCPHDPPGALSRRLHISGGIGKTVEIICEAPPSLPTIKPIPDDCAAPPQDAGLQYCMQPSPNSCQYDFQKRETCEAACNELDLPCIGGIDNEDGVPCVEQVPLKLTGCGSRLRSQLCICEAKNETQLMS